MTLSATPRRVTYDGSDAITPFPVTFQFFAASELLVVERVKATGAETAKVLGTHYTVSGGGGSTGTVTPLAAVSSSVQWIILGATAQTQTLDHVDGEAFQSEGHELALDRQVAMIQELAEKLARVLQFPVDEAAISGLLPPAIARAGLYLGFDADGKPAVLQGTTAGLAVTPFISSLLDDPSAATARATLGFPSPADPADDGRLLAAAGGGFVLSSDVRVLASGDDRTVLVNPMPPGASAGKGLVELFKATPAGSGERALLVYRGDGTDLLVDHKITSGAAATVTYFAGNGGRVAIGKKTASKKLDVAGDVAASAGFFDADRRVSVVDLTAVTLSAAAALVVEIPTSGHTLEVELADLLPSTGGSSAYLVLEVSTDGSSTWKATGYQHHSTTGDAASFLGYSSSSDTLMYLHHPGFYHATGSASGFFGRLRVNGINVGGLNVKPRFSLAAASFINYVPRFTGVPNFSGFWNGTDSVTHFRLRFVSGNINGRAQPLLYL